MTSSSRSSDSTSSKRPPPQLGQPAEKRFVHGAVDSQCEDADFAQLLAQRPENLVLIADLAIGHEHEDAVARFVA